MKCYQGMRNWILQGASVLSASECSGVLEQGAKVCAPLQTAGYLLVCQGGVFVGVIIPLLAHWWPSKFPLLMTGKESGSCWMLRATGVLNSSGISPLVAGFNDFNPPVARALRYGCLCLWLRFFSMPGSCHLAARVLNVVEKEQFYKVITQTGCIFWAEVSLQRGIGVQWRSFPFESRHLSYTSLVRKRRIDWGVWNGWNVNCYLHNQIVIIRGGKESSSTSSLCLMANLLIGQFPVEVNTLHVLFFPVTHKAGLLVSKETLVIFTCIMSLITPSALLSAGGTCQSPALPALVRPPAPPLQPSLDIKPFLPFPLDTAAAVNLFPNFNAVSPTVKFVYATVVDPGKR